MSVRAAGIGRSDADTGGGEHLADPSTTGPVPVWRSALPVPAVVRSLPTVPPESDLEPGPPESPFSEAPTLPTLLEGEEDDDRTELAPRLTATVSLEDDRQPIEELALVEAGAEDGSGPTYVNAVTAEQVARIEALIEAALAELRGTNQIAGRAAGDVRAIRQEQLQQVVTPQSQPSPLSRAGQEVCLRAIGRWVGNPGVAAAAVSIIGGAIAGATSAALLAVPTIAEWLMSLAGL